MPLFLEVSASEELLIAENIATFEGNGFRLKIDENAACGRRIQLLSVPFSKHIQFGQEDVRELASLIGDSQGGDGGSYISKLMLKNDRIDFRQGTGDADHGAERKGGGGEGDFHNGIGARANTGSDAHSSSSDSGMGSSNLGKRPLVGDSEVLAPSGLLRIPKLVSMFASRACRSAIMIGTAMQESEMKTVISRLEKIDQPWNCPHGRPTMRHLVDLLAVRKRRKINPICDLSRFIAYASELEHG